MIDGFADCDDVGFDDVRAFAFDLGDRMVWILWTGATGERAVDASAILGEGDVQVTRIVTALVGSYAPVVTPPRIVPSSAVTISPTPIFVERR